MLIHNCGMHNYGICCLMHRQPICLCAAVRGVSPSAVLEGVHPSAHQPTACSAAMAAAGYCWLLLLPSLQHAGCLPPVGQVAGVAKKMTGFTSPRATSLDLKLVLNSIIVPYHRSHIHSHIPRASIQYTITQKAIRSTFDLSLLLVEYFSADYL